MLCFKKGPVLDEMNSAPPPPPRHGVTRPAATICLLRHLEQLGVTSGIREYGSFHTSWPKLNLSSSDPEEEKGMTPPDVLHTLSLSSNWPQITERTDPSSEDSPTT